jgi:hypothetical protein
VKNGIELIKGLHSHYDFFPKANSNSNVSLFHVSKMNKVVERGDKKPCTFARKHFFLIFSYLKVKQLS